MFGGGLIEPVEEVFCPLIRGCDTIEAVFLDFQMH